MRCVLYCLVAVSLIVAQELAELDRQRFEAEAIRAGLDPAAAAAEAAKEAEDDDDDDDDDGEDHGEPVPKRGRPRGKMRRRGTPGRDGAMYVEWVSGEFSSWRALLVSTYSIFIFILFFHDSPSRILLRGNFW